MTTNCHANGDLDRCQWQGDDGLDHAGRILPFLSAIGIRVALGAGEPGASLLPGLGISRGTIMIDAAVPVWPGDLLHEAGHIAVTDQASRDALSKVPDDPGEEMAAIAWSVAAAHAICIPLDVVFHEAGYRGGSASLIEAFSGSGTPGVPLLAWWGLTVDPQRSTSNGAEVFPVMKRWLR